MAKLFDKFPELKNKKIIIRKMTEEDVDALMEITESENVYKYIPPFLYKKNRKFLSTAIKNIGGRDFDKKKMIIAGVYLSDNKDVLVGLAEMFDYKKRDNKITIGYRINEKYWNNGIATNIVKLVKEYLVDDIEINTIKAFVMPENTYSGKVLLKNGFVKEKCMVQEKNWGGQDTVEVEVYTFERNK